MKKILILIALVILSVNAFAAMNIEVTAVLGPRQNSPSLMAFYMNTTSNLMGHYRPANAPNNAPTEYAPLGAYLEPGFLVAPSTASSSVKQWRGMMNPTGVFALESGNTIWFTVRVWSDTKFNPKNIQVQHVSSDSGNVFGKMETFLSGNPGYGASSAGVVWNNDGSTTTIASGAWADSMVNEFVFVGSAAKTYVSTTQEQLTANLATINSFNNFYLVGTWKYVESNVVMASASKKLQLGGVVPPPPSFKITATISGGDILIDNVDTNSSVMLQKSSRINTITQWTDWMTITGPMSVHVAGADQEYFRLRVP